MRVIKMRIKIEIAGVTFKDVEDEIQHEFQLETDCYHSFNEVAKCIIESGYTIKAYRFFDGSD